MKPFEILIITGGTGGHIFPALACGEYFEKNGKRVLYFISGSKIGDLHLQNAFYFKALSLSRNLWYSLKAIYFALVNFAKGLIILPKYKPSVALATGSYAVLPFIISCKILKIPTFLMEQNVLPGQVNRWLSPFVKGIFVAFEESKKYLKGNVIPVGLPLREKAKTTYPKEESRERLNLPKDKPVILVIGGSLGAKGLIEKLIPVAVQFPHVHFVIQTGHRNFEYFKTLLSSQYGSPQNITLVPFIDDMGLYYSTADGVISRSGANACMEIAYHRKPAILVPYPYAKDNHQLFNAKVLEKSGLAVIIEEKELDKELANYLKDLSWTKTEWKGDSILKNDPERLIYEEIKGYADCQKV